MVEVLLPSSSGWATVRAPDELHAHMTASMRVSVMDQSIHRHRVAAQQGWDGMIPLYHWAGPGTDASVPVGVLRLLAHLLSACGAQVQWTSSTRSPPMPDGPHWPTIDAGLPGITLRPHQRRVLTALASRTCDALPHSCEQWGRVGLVDACTASGKTAMISATFVAYGGPRTLVLVPTAALVHQTIAEFRRHTGERHSAGRWSGGVAHIDANLVVATVQTIGALMRRDPEEAARILATFEMLILDEAHTMRGESSSRRSGALEAGTVSSVVRACPATIRFAFSGTPDADDPLHRAELSSWFGPPVATVTYGELIDAGYLARPVVYPVACMWAPPATSPDATLGDGASSGDYTMLYGRCVADNPERDELVKWTAARCARVGLRTLVLVQRIEQGQRLCAAMRAEGMHASFVSGEMSSKEQRAAFTAFDQGPPGTVLVANRVADTGIDMPNIGAMIQAGAGKSHVRQTQQIGRGVRLKADGDNRVLVFDITDRTATVLSRHSSKRIREYVTMSDNAFDLRPEIKAPTLAQACEAVRAAVVEFVAGKPGGP